MNSLRIEKLRYHQNGPIDLRIEAGETVCVSGESGTGKSLLLRALIDLEQHEGEIFFNEQECLDVDAPLWRRTLGLLPANASWWHDKVGEHFPKETSNANFADLGFPEDVSDWMVSRLSSGEKQRLALIRLLIQKPSVLLLDEPTAALDPENIAKVESILKKYQSENKSPCIWVTHQSEQVARVADRWFVMESGNLTERKMP